ncbi:MAG TPA: rhomboid family intramembrane serine protease [Candidatus Sulfotelmatobacter sp.]|nr:rhomboid family intramembrane serine protease [Candidatus Sulfotelmatobacter sp.]
MKNSLDEKMYNSEKYKPTYILIIINVLVYIYTSVVGGNFLETAPNLIYKYGQVGFYVMEGSYYQLVTSMFVHATIVHIAGNMIFLLVFGLRGEEMFSLPEYLAVYFLGGLFGNVLSLFFLPLDVPSVGASGAIFALFGAVIIHARRAVGQSVIGALIYGFFLLFLSSAPNVNNLAHIGGLVIGLIIGYVLAARRKHGTQYKVTYSYGSPLPL